MQYAFQALTAMRRRGHIQRYINEVKEVAWRPHGGNPPPSGAMKYVTLADQSEEGSGPSRKFGIDFTGSVYFVDTKTGEESLLDVSEVPGADWRSTLICKLPLWIWNITVGKALKKSAEKAKVNAVLEDDKAVQGNGKDDIMSKYVKAEKVGGKRKAKKRN